MILTLWIIALILWTAAAIGYPTGRFNLVAAGLVCVALTHILPFYP